jgi:putative phosphoribosyl transferase
MPSPFARRDAAGASPGPPAFADRAEAGVLLGAAVHGAIGEFTFDYAERPVVFAIPRGGVAVAAGVARQLNASLDVVVVRKIGHPQAPEFGLGAIAEGGEPVFDPAALDESGLEVADLAEVVARERTELARRVGVYRGTLGLPPGTAAGPRAGERASAGPLIVVDDGLATGVTARAALRAVRARGGPGARTVLAVPVAAANSLAAIKAEADDVVTVVTTRRLRSVGEWYVDFGQLTDADVLTLLAAGP